MEVKFTLRRPMNAERCAQTGMVKCVVPPGSVVVEFGTCTDGAGFIKEDAAGNAFIQTNHQSLLEACAASPCPHFRVEWDGEYSEYYIPNCSRYDGGNGDHIAFCMADMARCPSRTIREQAKQAGGEQS